LLNVLEWNRTRILTDEHELHIITDKIRKVQSGLDINVLKEIFRRYAPQNDMLHMSKLSLGFITTE